jgi:hypothetical protein
MCVFTLGLGFAEGNGNGNRISVEAPLVSQPMRQENHETIAPNSAAEGVTAENHQQRPAGGLIPDPMR